jgi:acyl-coenzyme A synthetase/AMP-(fatty) acid ligase
LCPPDLAPEHVGAVAADAEIETVVCDDDAFLADLAVPARHVACSPLLVPCPRVPDQLDTEWVLLTSGTSGRPKMVVHTLASLAGAIERRAEPEPVVWATFYDIRRYGGLQILLRALIGGTPLILTHKGEPVGDHLARLARHGVTHLTGTPSHWRNALMSPACRCIVPRYVRLSGEIADQAILDHLRSVYFDARIVHAYASTEAGVGFEVADGREGFPVSLLEPGGAVEMKIVDGSLRIRSGRAALRYLGVAAAPVADADGFVDTGDMIAVRGDRCHFVGRRGGIINIGGAKVHPEEVEAAINRHPDVRMSRVRARKSPITGAVVVADVVLEAAGENAPTAAREAAIRAEILQLCRGSLARHKVPAALNFVSSLRVSAGGKLVREHA